MPFSRSAPRRNRKRKVKAVYSKVFKSFFPTKYGKSKGNYKRRKSNTGRGFFAGLFD